MSCCGPAGLHNFLCNQGATFTRTLTWTDSAKKARDLTGYTARMQVRSSVESSSVIVELTTVNGKITLGTTTDTKGQVTLLLSATTTAALTPGQYVYDLELVSAGGEVTRLLEGNFVVKAEVTR
jgi:hypothetical protein